MLNELRQSEKRRCLWSCYRHCFLGCRNLYLYVQRFACQSHYPSTWCMSFRIYSSADVWLQQEKGMFLLFDYSSVPVPVNPSFISLCFRLAEKSTIKFILLWSRYGNFYPDVWSQIQDQEAAATHRFQNILCEYVVKHEKGKGMDHTVTWNKYDCGVIRQRRTCWTNEPCNCMLGVVDSAVISASWTISCLCGPELHLTLRHIFPLCYAGTKIWIYVWVFS